MNIETRQQHFETKDQTTGYVDSIYAGKILQSVHHEALQPKASAIRINGKWFSAVGDHPLAKELEREWKQLAQPVQP